MRTSPQNNQTDDKNTIPLGNDKQIIGRENKRVCDDKWQIKDGFKLQIVKPAI